MSKSEAVHINGTLSNAIDMALFFILVSVILAVFWYIIFFVIGLIFGASKKEGMVPAVGRANNGLTAVGRGRANNLNGQLTDTN